MATISAGPIFRRGCWRTPDALRKPLRGWTARLPSIPTTPRLGCGAAVGCLRPAASKPRSAPLTRPANAVPARKRISAKRWRSWRKGTPRRRCRAWPASPRKPAIRSRIERMAGRCWPWAARTTRAWRWRADGRQHRFNGAIRAPPSASPMCAATPASPGRKPSPARARRAPRWRCSSGCGRSIPRNAAARPRISSSPATC